ncbi:hypothetical protein U1Q18_013104, partial [Sarracenia purpurea var. burkii]
LSVCINTFTKDLFNQFMDANTKGSKEEADPPDQTTLRRNPPGYGIFKVNVDDACDSNMKVAGIGIVVRNWE